MLNFLLPAAIAQNVIRDAQGRQRIYHGINLVVKNPPYHPVLDNCNSTYPISLCDADLAQLRTLGINAIRLGVMWPGVQKADGVWDKEYLDLMVNLVNKAGDYGISTLVQFHQDLASERYCGDGIPSWLLKKMAGLQDKTFPFPLQAKPFKLNNQSNFICDSKRSWGEYYFTLAVGSTFNKLYHNKQGLRDRFISYWKQVSKAFKGNKNVIAYQIINQPFAGDVITDPALLIPPVAQHQNLQRFYDIVSDGIRQVDNQTPICFEPVTWDNTLRTGFTHVPGGQKYANKSIFCYHLYKPPSLNILKTMKARIKDAERLSVPPLLSQFWFQNSDSQEILTNAQTLQQSWFFWHYKSIDHRKLSRTYAQAVAGTIIRQFFDNATKQYLLQMTACQACGQTEVYLNSEHYPQGAIVQVQPRSVSWRREERRVRVQGKEGERMIIRISKL